MVTNEQMQTLQVLVDKTNRHDAAPADVAALRALLRTMPDAWRAIGDLTTQVREQLLSESTPAAIEGVRMAMEVQRRELGYQDAPANERLLIDHLLICWLRLFKTEQWYTKNQRGSIEYMEYVERTLSAAQRRYLRASETLAKVRRLNARTPLQVNIGAQQLNIAGDVTP